MKMYKLSARAKGKVKFAITIDLSDGSTVAEILKHLDGSSCKQGADGQEAKDPKQSAAAEFIKNLLKIPVPGFTVGGGEVEPQLNAEGHASYSGATSAPNFERPLTERERETGTATKTKKPVFQQPQKVKGFGV